MKNVYILCEGPTEESFINNVLSPHLIGNEVYIRPIVLSTKRTAERKYRGGVSTYGKIKRELSILCKQHHNEFVTTMFDYYAMPQDTPGIDLDDADIQVRINKIESIIDSDVGASNCKFHFMLHEFEGILFSDPDSFSIIADESVIDKIRAIKNSYPNPEYIDQSPETAPSKRLKNLIPGYSKVRNGTILAETMGIQTILNNCQHFREWVEYIKNLQ